MIRRISKSNDYRDIIKSCPSGVIDDIYSIRYFISGHPETEVEASFTKKGNLLEVILPTSLLIELGNGVLMRRALYSDVDASFPDGEYNLEFVDDLNVWLGSEETDPPFDPSVEYATKEYVDEQDAITRKALGDYSYDTDNRLDSLESTVSSLPDDITAVANIASQAVSVASQAYDVAVSLSSQVSEMSSQVSTATGMANAAMDEAMATRAMVSGVEESLSYVEASMSYLASEVSSQSSSIDNLTDYVRNLRDTVDSIAHDAATQQDIVDYVDSQGFYQENPNDPVATQGYVDNAGFYVEDPNNPVVTEENGMTYNSTYPWISILPDYGYNVDVIERPMESGSTEWYNYEATKNIILAHKDIVKSNDTYDLDTIMIGTDEYGDPQLYKAGFYDVNGDNYERIDKYVTESDVSGTLSSYATRQWVTGRGYITSSDLSGYATTSDVSTAISTAISTALSDYTTTSDVSTAISSALSGYATEQYVDNAIAEATWGSEVPLPENVVEYDTDHPLIEDFGYNVDVLKRNTFDHTSGGHMTDRITKGLVLAYEETYSNDVITDMDTIEIRDGLLASVHYDFDEVDGQPDYHESRSYYATESYVINAVSVGVSGYATQSDVSTAISTALSGYATTSDVTTAIATSLSGYATQSDVSTAISVALSDYVTTSDLSSTLSDYATIQWVQNAYGTRNWTSNNFVAQSSVWTGTQAQWNQLSASEKASYTIALITQ